MKLEPLSPNPPSFFHEHLQQKKNTDKKVYRQPPCTTNNGHTAEMFRPQDQGDRDKEKHTHTHAWITTHGHTTDHPQADYNCVGVKWMGTLQQWLPSARMRGVWWHRQPSEENTLPAIWCAFMAVVLEACGQAHYYTRSSLSRAKWRNKIKVYL